MHGLHVYISKMGRLAERNRLPTVYGLGYLCVAQRHSKVRMHATDDAFNDGSFEFSISSANRDLCGNSLPYSRVELCCHDCRSDFWANVLEYYLWTPSDCKTSPLGATICSRLMAHNPDSPIFALAVLAITRVLPCPHYPLSKLG